MGKPASAPKIRCMRAASAFHFSAERGAPSLLARVSLSWWQPVQSSWNQRFRSPSGDGRARSASALEARQRGTLDESAVRRCLRPWMPIAASRITSSMRK